MSLHPEPPAGALPSVADVPVGPAVPAGASREPLAGGAEASLDFTPAVDTAAATLAPRRTAADRAVIVLAVLASLFALHEARDFLVPVVLSIVIAYLLDPPVYRLQRMRVPRALGATVVLLAVVAAVLLGAYLLHGQVQSIVDRLPEIAGKLSRTAGTLMSGDDSMWQKVSRAAKVLAGPQPRGPMVVAAAPGSELNHMLWAGSMSVFAVVGQCTVVLFLVYFLLLCGDMFKRKFIKLAGRTISEKKMSVHMLDEINLSIQRYMAMLLVTNAALGVCTWLLLKWLGVDNAASWAVVAAALHLVPYFGALLITICLGIAAFMQFGTLGIAAAAAGGSMLIATLIGSVVQTWTTGRMARMNPAAVFVALLLFTWLWGTWGMLLAIPLAVITKVVADHVEGLDFLAEFLGE